MAEKSAILVVGGDSLVGQGVAKALQRRETPFLVSTRRVDTLGPGRIHVDFEDADTFVALKNIGCAVVVAAATNYDRCESDPHSRVVNVELIPRFVENLLKQEVHVVFVSTNSVFGGERAWPLEDDAHDAKIAYALQKSQAETAVVEAAAKLSASKRVAIVRLTKILDEHTPPLPAWLETWQRGGIVTPFDDLVFAPMSVTFVGEALAEIALKKVCGNLHLSGADNVTYTQFARALADRLKIAPDKIAPTSAVEKGVHIAFKPTYSGLGMAKTTRLTGLAPQPLESVIEDIFSTAAQGIRYAS